MKVVQFILGFLCIIWVAEPVNCDTPTFPYQYYQYDYNQVDDYNTDYYNQVGHYGHNNHYYPVPTERKSYRPSVIQKAFSRLGGALRSVGQKIDRQGLAGLLTPGTAGLAILFGLLGVTGFIILSASEQQSAPVITMSAMPIPIPISNSVSVSSNSLAVPVSAPPPPGGRRKRRQTNEEYYETIFCDSIAIIQDCSIQNIMIFNMPAGIMRVDFVIVLTTTSSTPSMVNELQLQALNVGAVVSSCEGNSCSTCPDGSALSSGLGSCGTFTCGANSCNSQGTCSMSGTMCDCNNPFGGIDCSIPLPADLQACPNGGFPEENMNAVGMEIEIICCTSDDKNNIKCVCMDPDTDVECDTETEVFLKTICCPEGQVEDSGTCRDTCTEPLVSSSNICTCPTEGFNDYDGLCCEEGQVSQTGECMDACDPNYVSNDGICDCDSNNQDINKIYVDDTNTNFLCCPEGEVVQNGACMDQCTDNFVRTDSGLCDCIGSEDVNRIPNPSDKFKPFVCCSEGEVNQGGICQDACDAEFNANADGLCK